jgi:hypothetical protein
VLGVLHLVEMWNKVPRLYVNEVVDGKVDVQTAESCEFGWNRVIQYHRKAQTVVPLSLS